MNKILFIAIPFISFSLWAQSFPKDFQWCVATNGHQIDGDDMLSDWWAWEQHSGKVAGNHKSGKASSHIDLVDQDIDLISNTGANTYRFSIEWSRVEPEMGSFDADAIKYYHHELDLLKERGIRPMITLSHFSHPVWFTGGDGWKRKDAVELFLKYVAKVESEFGPRVDQWVTFNDPAVYLFAAYGAAVRPPGDTNLDLWVPLQNILKAHARTYKYLHEKARMRNQTIYVGMAHQIRPLEGTNWLMKKLVGYVDFYLNWNILTALKTGNLKGLARKGVASFRLLTIQEGQFYEIKDTQDFIGINYFTREVITLNFTAPYLHRSPQMGLPLSDMGWGIDPKGLYEVMKQVHQLYPDKPIYITENGIADQKDNWREKYVRSHLAEVHRAMQDLKIHVIGYCYSSLMDGFEWQDGFGPRYGLYEVDYEAKGRRTPRPSIDPIRKIFRTGEI